MSVPQETVLRSIVFTMPVHVHTPVAHIGTIYSDLPEENVNAAELIRCLQVIYNQLSQKKNVQAESSSRAEAHSSRGSSATEGGPVGNDPLLGNDEVWGLEPASFEGYSVIHLAGHSN